MKVKKNANGKRVRVGEGGEKVHHIGKKNRRKQSVLFFTFFFLWTSIFVLLSAKVSGLRPSVFFGSGAVGGNLILS